MVETSPLFCFILRWDFFYYISWAQDSFLSCNFINILLNVLYSRLKCGTCKFWYAHKKHTNFDFEHLQHFILTEFGPVILALPVKNLVEKSSFIHFLLIFELYDHRELYGSLWYDLRYLLGLLQCILNHCVQWTSAGFEPVTTLTESKRSNLSSTPRSR